MEDFNKKFKVNEFLIYETRYWKWSLRPHQPVLGASILSLKRNCTNFSDISEEEAKDLRKIVIIIEETLKETFDYDVINYMMLMMFDKEVHYHVFPRYEEVRELNGEKWIDEKWPSVPQLSGEELKNNKAKEIINKIKIKINNKDNRMKKYKIGYTTGTFDMFHIGHLNILKKAKEQCDYLIVAVTTDEAVKYKNKTPIIPEKERLEIVKSIKYVDQAVYQEDANDKFGQWEKYKFDVLFVGSDWQGTKKWNQFEIDFKKVNVDIVYFPYTEGTSSTILREKLLNIKD